MANPPTVSIPPVVVDQEGTINITIDPALDLTGGTITAKFVSISGAIYETDGPIVPDPDQVTNQGIAQWTLGKVDTHFAGQFLFTATVTDVPGTELRDGIYSVSFDYDYIPGTLQGDVRAYLGDTILGQGPKPNHFNFTNQEITRLLELSQQGLTGAVINGVRQLIALWTPLAVEERDGDFWYDGKQIVERYKTMLDDLRKSPLETEEPHFYGGLVVQRIDAWTAEANPDRLDGSKEY